MVSPVRHIRRLEDNSLTGTLPREWSAMESLMQM